MSGLVGLAQRWPVHVRERGSLGERHILDALKKNNSPSKRLPTWQENKLSNVLVENNAKLVENAMCKSQWGADPQDREEGRWVWPKAMSLRLASSLVPTGLHESSEEKTIMERITKEACRREGTQVEPLYDFKTVWHSWRKRGSSHSLCMEPVGMEKRTHCLSQNREERSIHSSRNALYSALSRYLQMVTMARLEGHQKEAHSEWDTLGSFSSEPGKWGWPTRIFRQEQVAALASVTPIGDFVVTLSQWPRDPCFPATPSP